MEVTSTYYPQSDGCDRHWHVLVVLTRKFFPFKTQEKEGDYHM